MISNYVNKHYLISCLKLFKNKDATTSFVVASLNGTNSLLSIRKSRFSFLWATIDDSFLTGIPPSRLNTRLHSLPPIVSSKTLTPTKNFFHSFYQKLHQLCITQSQFTLNLFLGHHLMCKPTKLFSLQHPLTLPSHKRHLHYNTLPHESLLPISNIKSSASGNQSRAKISDSSLRQPGFHCLTTLGPWLCVPSFHLVYHFGTYKLIILSVYIKVNSFF